MQKISLIIPVYKTEKYLEKCLTSVIEQTYKNIEIIVINDCSPDNSEQIILNYQKKDNRIKYIKNEKNLGLFHSRLIGADAATGDYIAFLDSDDYVSCDIYRLAIEKSQESSSDIVMFKFVRFEENGRYYIQNLIDFDLDSMTGDQLRKRYFEQEGLFYNYHTVWNKIYKKELWDNSRKYFDNMKNHLIMTEDIAFSTVLISNCNKFSFVNEYGLFYLVRDDASTSGATEFKKIKKNIYDIVQVFNFVEQFIYTFRKDLLTYEKNIHGFKERYYRMWYEHINLSLSGKEKKECIKLIQEGTNIYEHVYKKEEDFLALEIESTWDPRWDELKKKVISSETKIVSFDIFDTLVVRPFLNTTDLFYFLDLYYCEITNYSSIFDFSKLRIKAENKARHNSKYEDVTIFEIYKVLVDDFSIPQEIAFKMCTKECELEVEFCYRRNSIVQLYDLVKYLKKSIIIVSDMYLDVATIEAILEKNNITEYKKLYVSSETRKLKSTTNMFRHIISDLKIKPEHILHIGDNWEADKVASEKVGIRGEFIPKTSNYLKNNLSDKDSGYIYDELLSGLGVGIKDYQIEDDFFNNTMLAVAANIIYDNPFITFNGETNYNAKPQYIGTLAFGNHLLALVKWIIEDAKTSNYGTVHFIARDGYMPKKAYEIIKKFYKSAPKINYISASRRSIIPLLFSNNIDRYGLLEILALDKQTRGNIKKMINIILKDDFKLDPNTQDDKFKSEDELIEFIDYLDKEAISMEKLKKYEDVTRQYLSQIESNDATFDLGYSGRIQNIISMILNKEVDTYYLHSDKIKANKISKTGNFKIKTFLNYKPVISGAFREYFYASNDYSCIGFQKKNGTIEVLNDKASIEKNYHNIELLQISALKFIEKYAEIFHTNMEKMDHNNEVSSMLLENFFSHPKEADRTFIRFGHSEDYAHSGEMKSNVYKNWNYELGKFWNEKNKKEIVKSYEDEQNFQEKVKQKIKSNKHTYFFAKKIKNKIKRN